MLGVWLSLLGFSVGLTAREASVAAASSLGFVLPDIAVAYQNKTGKSVKLIFSSSRTLVHQIIAGASFEVFLSADAESIRILQERSLTVGRKVLYGRGRLALFALQRSRVNLLADLNLLSDLGRIRKIAIANPEIAPYGRIARQALQAGGLWDRLATKLVFGQSALQSAQFAVSGSVDIALIPYTLVLSPRFIDRGQSILISEKLYSPLKHEMIMIRGGGDDAKAFFMFLQSELAKSRFRASGL